MKFMLGEPPGNQNFDLVEFVKLEEPSKEAFMRIALVLQICLWVVFLIVWLLVDSNFFQNLIEMGIASFLLALFIALVIHEILHAVTYPVSNDNQVIFGCWPEMGALYASFDGELSRNRWLTVYAMPFLCISIVPLILSTSGVPAWAKFASLLNAGFSVGDLLASP